jgi:hypothetical protein
VRLQVIEPDDQAEIRAIRISPGVFIRQSAVAVSHGDDAAAQMPIGSGNNGQLADCAAHDYLLARLDATFGKVVRMHVCPVR